VHDPLDFGEVPAVARPDGDGDELVLKRAGASVLSVKGDDVPVRFESSDVPDREVERFVAAEM